MKVMPDGITFKPDIGARNQVDIASPNLKFGSQKRGKMIEKVLKKKAKRIFPAAVEGKFIHRIDIAKKEASETIDRKIGYETRKLLSSHTKTVPNRIMFITFNHGYSCNPKYICEELLNRKADVEIYWGVNNTETRNGVPEAPNIHLVKMNSYEYFEAACTSGVIVINSLLGDKFYPFPVRPDQIIYETWHGSLGIKRFDLAHYNTNVSWPEAAKRTGKLTTYCISNSAFEESVFRETFWEKTPILRLGHARNDVFFDTYREKRAEWREKFIRENSLDSDVKFVLYAPTFRDTHNFAVYDLDADRLLGALKERFGGKWKLLLRYHDNDRKNEKKKNTVVSPDVIDVTQYADIQEMLAFADAGITDYSSWIYDFMLSRRPGFIYARDIDLYNDERGFYFRLEDTPFPVAKDNDEMEANILAFDGKSYEEKCDTFLAARACIDDGHSSQRIADEILFRAGLS